ncbi:hypothetical protein PG989_006727 [Apiospora arundinis]
MNPSSYSSYKPTDPNKPTMDGLHKDPPFKVIIVGAGVSGLTLAHSLHKAGIDYVVLDKHPVAPAWGTSITIHPLGARILDQLGCLKALDEKCTPMHNFWNRGPDGKSYHCEPFFDQLSERNGYLSYTTSRQGFLQTLYDALPDKSKVIENARLQEVIQEGDTVRAVCADGAVHEGDLIVGADGVHSTVREFMWQHANLTHPGSVTVAEKRQIRTSYNCLLGMAPMMPGLGTQDMHCVSFDKYSFLLLTQPDAIFFIVHCKLPGGATVAYPDRARYSAADAEAKAAELAGCPISDTLVFGDLWRARTRGHLVSLEEGVLTRLHAGRAVLAGDGAHKFTPNSALGGSMAMESAVVLANELHHAVARHPNKKPSAAELEAALRHYQDIRVPRLREGLNVSWVLTRAQAYDGFFMYLLQRWVIPTIGLNFVAGVAAEYCSRAPKLTYVPFEEKCGSLAWQEFPSPLTRNIAARKKKGGILGMTAPIAVACVALVALGYWMFSFPPISPSDLPLLVTNSS